MKKATRAMTSIFCLTILSSACQSVSVPKAAKVIDVPPPALKDIDVIPEHVGEFVRFEAEIEFPYRVLCSEQINDDDACPLLIHDTAHTINIINGLNKNNVTTSSQIIFSDGSHGEPDIFGLVAARITALVKKCDEKKVCELDAYQIDLPTE
jgi:hypothetical protein